MCPLTGAPAEVEKEQLSELGISMDIRIKEKREKEEITEKKKEISIDEVKHIARLARLMLNRDELETISNDLSGIPSYVNQLNELNTEDIPPTTGVLEIKNVWQEDKISEDKVQRAQVMDDAPEREGEYFKVPKVIQ